MEVNQKTIGQSDKRRILSTLWIFACLNYLYADVFTLFFHPLAHETAATIPQGAVLVYAILMETALAMVLLSRILKHGPNRWANMAAGVFHTAFVGWSMTGEEQLPFYIFFASVEMLCTLFIAWYAWKWTKFEG